MERLKITTRNEYEVPVQQTTERVVKSVSDNTKNDEEFIPVETIALPETSDSDNEDLKIKPTTSKKPAKTGYGKKDSRNDRRNGEYAKNNEDIYISITRHLIY